MLTKEVTPLGTINNPMEQLILDHQLNKEDEILHDRGSNITIFIFGYL